MTRWLPRGCAISSSFSGLRKLPGSDEIYPSFCRKTRVFIGTLEGLQSPALFFATDALADAPFPPPAVRLLGAMGAEWKTKDEQERKEKDEAAQGEVP